MKKEVNGVKIFRATICLIYFVLALKLFVPSIQRKFIEQFHHVRTPFGAWALMQFVPWMYNCGNEVWISVSPLSSEVVANSVPPGVYHTWLNHHPLRIVTFALYRNIFFDGAEKRFLMARSRYQNQEVVSLYILQRTNQGLVIQPVDAKKEAR